MNRCEYKSCWYKSFDLVFMVYSVNRITIISFAITLVLPEGRGTLNKDAEALLIELDQAKQELKWAFCSWYYTFVPLL